MLPITFMGIKGIPSYQKLNLLVYSNLFSSSFFPPTMLTSKHAERFSLVLSHTHLCLSTWPIWGSILLKLRGLSVMMVLINAHSRPQGSTITLLHPDFLGTEPAPSTMAPMTTPIMLLTVHSPEQHHSKVCRNFLLRVLTSWVWCKRA